MAWNCRGLGCTSTNRRLKQLPTKYQPDFCFLSETLQSFDSVSHTLKSMGFDNLVGLDSVEHSGGLVWAWKSGFQVQVLQLCQNWIHIKVKNFNQAGPPKLQDRCNFWQFIMKESQNVKVPWLLLGDFSQVLRREDKFSSCYNMDGAFEFQNAINQSAIVELNSTGLWYTWTNNKVGCNHV